MVHRKTSLTVLMAAFIASYFFIAATSDPFEKGLIAYYSFDECDARDETEFGSDGKLYGNPGCHCGVSDDALWFDGVHDYIEFNGRVNDYFTTSDFTISFYFKPGKYSVFKQSLLSKRELCDEYNMFDLQLDLNNHLVDTDVHETPTKDFSDISPPLDSTAWQHFALVREGIRAYTYINGQPRQQGTRCSGIDLTNPTVLSFANSPCIRGGRTVRFKGGLDELRVYDHALSSEEIANLYARHPVESAEQDCITYSPKNSPERQLNEVESSYLCALF